MQRRHFFFFPFMKAFFVMLGCLGLFVRCTLLEKTARVTGFATDTANKPFADFVEHSRPQSLEYRPLYVDEQRRSSRSNMSPSENTKTFKDLEQDLDRELNRAQKAKDMPR